MGIEDVLDQAISKRNLAVLEKVLESKPKRDILDRVEKTIPTYVRDFIKQSQPSYDIPALIAQELAKRPKDVIQKVLEKETIVREVEKKDPRKYTEEKDFKILGEKIKELEDMIERIKRFAIHGGSGVIGLPSLQGHAGQFLSNNGSQPSWVDGGAANGTFIIGDGSNGSWRFRVSGTDLLHERLESGTWVEKARDLA